MIDLLELALPYLAIFYLLDGITQVERGHLLFLSHFGGRFRLKRSGIQFAGLMPQSRAILCHDIRICPTDEGVHLPAGDPSPDRALSPEDFRFVPYENMSAVADGPSLAVNGAAVHLPSPRVAREMAGVIRELRDAPPPLRRDRLRDFVDGRMDLQSVRNTLAAGTPVRILEALCSLLFVLTFVLLPLSLYAAPIPRRILFVLPPAIGLTYLAVLAAAYVSHRKMHPADRGDRARSMLLLVLLPPGAIRAPSVLTKDLLAGFDPLAAGAALLSPDAFRAMARRELVRIRASRDALGPDLGKFFRMRERALLSLLAAGGIAQDEILAPPRGRDPGSSAYCPMCETEYTVAAGHCGDCDVDLAAFGPESACTRP